MFEKLSGRLFNVCWTFARLLYLPKCEFLSKRVRASERERKREIDFDEMSRSYIESERERVWDGCLHQ